MLPRRVSGGCGHLFYLLSPLPLLPLLSLPSPPLPFSDKKALEKMVKGLVWYTPTDTELRNYGDGGVAIIDQWISAHGRYFIGTTYSTFSFRIREDRQFLGFSKESTFNDLCGPENNEHDPHSCKKPAYWKWDGVPPKIGSPSSDREEL